MSNSSEQRMIEPTPTLLHAATILARLDRLPPSRYVSALIVVLALGGAFEIYDIALTGLLVPGLVRGGVFHADARGLFGLTDQAAFGAATFAGLYVGTAVVASAVDRLGRRLAFVAALLWYSFFGLLMALQSSASGVDLIRFVASIGIGVQLITLDSYIAELAAPSHRGRAFAIGQSVQYIGVPVAAFLSATLLMHDPAGVAGWRWVAALPLAAALLAFSIYRVVPESPRWLAARGRLREADAVVELLERHAGAPAMAAAPLLASEVPLAPATMRTGLSEIWKPQLRTRTIMLIVYNFFQAIGYYGFVNWVPTLLAAQGVTVTKSLVYSAVIALVYPLCPLLFLAFADRIERKHQIVAAAMGMAVFGILFGYQRAAAALVALGMLLTLAGSLLSYAGHAYQAELYPTGVRSKAIGFVYSFSRLSTIFSSFLIAITLRDFGPSGVFTVIAGSMLIVSVAVGTLGPRTGGIALDRSPSGAA